MSVPSSHDDRPESLASQLWGVAELATVFSVKESTIRRWAREGKLPRPTGPGRTPRWAAGEIRKLVGGVEG